jgi:3-oxoacyl-[acyl-carrier protein] reductase
MTDSTDFSNRTYAILGGSGGIGSTISTKLHDAGARLEVASRSIEAYEEFDWANEAGIHEVNAMDPDEIENWLRSVAPDQGLDGVVNAVGSIVLKPLHRTDYEEWQETLSLNLTSCFALLRGYVDNLTKHGGDFVAFSSAAAGQGIPNHEAIAAAKAGVEGLVRSSAATYANRNLRVNGISPGLVETSLSEDMLRSERAREQSESMHALGRLGEPQDPADAALWLLNPDTDWVTGEIIAVDGGLRNCNSK